MWKTLLLLSLPFVLLHEDDVLFSKFFQTDYETKDYRCDVLDINRKFLKELRCHQHRYNRTTKVCNITILPLVDIVGKDDLRGSVQIYKRYGTDFKYFPIQFNASWCKAIEHNVFGINNVDCEQLKCPYYKNVRRHACNWIPNPSYLPPLIPEGEYKVMARLTYKGQFFSTVEAFLTVYRKVKMFQ